MKGPVGSKSKTYSVIVDTKGDPKASAALLSGLNGAAIAQMIGK